MSTNPHNVKFLSGNIADIDKINKKTGQILFAIGKTKDGKEEKGDIYFDASETSRIKMGAWADAAENDGDGNSIASSYLFFKKPFERELGKTEINYKAYNAKNSLTTDNYFSIPSATTADAGLISAKTFQRFSGIKVFDDNIVLNHIDQTAETTSTKKTNALIFANNANTEKGIVPYASWRMAYHAEGIDSNNTLDFETGELNDEHNKDNWYSVLQIQPNSSTQKNYLTKKRHGFINIFGNAKVTHDLGPRIYFSNLGLPLDNSNKPTAPVMNGWMGLNESNNRLGIYDVNAGFYLIRNYSGETEDINKYKSIDVSTEGSFYILGTSNGNLENRNLYVRMGSQLNENKTNQIALRVTTDLKQGLYSSYGKWLIYFDPLNSLYKLESPTLSHYIGSKTSNGGYTFSAYRKWPDIKDEEGNVTSTVTEYSNMHIGLNSSGQSIFFEIKSFNSANESLKDKNEENPDIIYYMNKSNFITNLDGEVGLGASTRRWQYIYSRYLYSRIDWDDYNSTVHNTPSTMPFSIYLLSDDTSLTTIEDTKSPGIGFATGTGTKKLRGSLILNQEGFKFKDADNDKFRPIHVDSLFLRTTSKGEKDTGHIIFSRVPEDQENGIAPNYLRLPAAHGQIAIGVNEQNKIENTTFIVDEKSIFPGKNNTFDFGKESYRWRDGYLSGTLHLTNSGRLRIYGSSTGYTDIIAGTNNSSKYTMYLPGASGQFVYHTNDTQIGSEDLPVFVSSGGQVKEINDLFLGSKSSNTGHILRFSRKYSGDADTNNTTFSMGITSNGQTGYLRVVKYADATTTEYSGEAYYIFSIDSMHPSVNNSKTLGTSSAKWKNVYATTFTGALTGNADSATKIYSQAENKTVYVSRYIPFFENVADENKSLKHNSGFKFDYKVGSTTAGEAYLLLGTSTSSTKANNSRGNILLYGTNTGYTNILSLNNTTTNTKIYLPNPGANNGTLAYIPYNTSVGSSTRPVYINSVGLVKTITHLYIGSRENNDSGYIRVYRKFQADGNTNNTGFSLGVTQSGETGYLQVLRYPDANSSEASEKTLYCFGLNAIFPNDDNIRTLGTSNFKWKDVYATNFIGNASTATQLATKVALKIGKTSKDFNGSAPLTWTHTDIGATVSNSVSDGDESGPTIYTTVNGVKSSGVVIPKASDSVSGVITTGMQTIAGGKTFIGGINIKNSTYWSKVGFFNTNLNKVGLEVALYSPLNEANTAVTNNQLYIRVYSYKTGTKTLSGGHDNYRLPSVTTDLTSEEKNYYDILTTKDKVTLKQGGTGANLSDIPAGAIVRNSSNNTGLWYTATKKGAFYASADNGLPSFGTLPVDMGGTGNTSFTGGCLIRSNTAGSQIYSSAISISGNTLSSIKSGTEGVAFKVGNDNGTVAIYVATNMGLYDFTANDWLIYKHIESNVLRTPLTLHLSKNVDAEATLDNRPPLIIGSLTGQHLEIDANEIMAKGTGTSASGLNLNIGGGAVAIGGGSDPITIRGATTISGTATISGVTTINNTTTVGGTDKTAGYTLKVARKGNSTTESTYGILTFGISESSQSSYIRFAHTNSTDTSKSTNMYFYLNNSVFRPDSTETTNLGSSSYRWNTMYSKNINVTEKGTKTGQVLANLGVVYSASEPTNKYEGLVWLCPA